MIRILRDVVVRNWALKLFALVLALVLWLTLIPEEKTFSENTIVTPLELRNLRSDYVLVERPATTVDVTVRAPNRVLSQMTEKDVRAVLDLGRARADQEDYPLNPEMISVPPGAKVVRVFPNMVHLKIEPDREVLMDVQVNPIGKVKTGFVLEKVEVIPSQVAVRGPESKFKAKDKVRTSPVEITDLEQSTTVSVDLILPRPELRLAAGQTRATIIVTITKKDEKK